MAGVLLNLYNFLKLAPLASPWKAKMNDLTCNYKYILFMPNLVTFLPAWFIGSFENAR